MFSLWRTMTTANANQRYSLSNKIRRLLGNIQKRGGARQCIVVSTNTNIIRLRPCLIRTRKGSGGSQEERSGDEWIALSFNTSLLLINIICTGNGQYYYYRLMITVVNSSHFFSFALVFTLLYKIIGVLYSKYLKNGNQK